MCVSQAEPQSRAFPDALDQLVAWGQHDAARNLAELLQASFTASGLPCPWDAQISSRLASIQLLLEVHFTKLLCAFVKPCMTYDVTVCETVLTVTCRSAAS